MEALIRAVENENATGELRWRIGMPVLIQEDGAYWGPGDLNAVDHLGRRIHYLLKVPGVTVAQFNSMLQTKWGNKWDDKEVDALDPEGERPLRLRKIDFVANDLPTGIKNQLASTGTVTLTQAQARKVLRHIVRNERESL